MSNHLFDLSDATIEQMAIDTVSTFRYSGRAPFYRKETAHIEVPHELFQELRRRSHKFMRVLVTYDLMQRGFVRPIDKVPRKCVASLVGQALLYSMGAAPTLCLVQSDGYLLFQDTEHMRDYAGFVRAIPGYEYGNTRGCKLEKLLFQALQE